MPKYCAFCGKQLNEGETCDCQTKTNPIPDNSKTTVQQTYPIKEASTTIAKTSKMIPIGQTVAGGLLAILGLLSIDYAWGEISLVAAFGFLWTGILELVKKDHVNK